MSGKKPVNAATYREVVTKLCEKQQAKTVVEIGVYTGELSKLLLTVKTVEKLYLVDPWEAYAHYSQELMDKNYDIVCDLFAKDERVSILRMRSTSPLVASFVDESIDFLHIDGDHNEDAVRDDIRWWEPKLKWGGMITGDNYEFDGVAAAVDALIPDRKLAAKGRVWWRLK